MFEYVLGVDGCRRGWLVCRYEFATSQLIYEIHPNFAEVLRRHENARYIAVDVPIGLTEDGHARRCDLEARQLLRAPRASSVFPAPARRLLSEGSYLAACSRSREVCGKGLTRQAFGIFGKIAEVDALMTPEVQNRVFEVHPELCFCRFGGVAMQNPKRKAAGYDERRNVLTAATPLAIPEHGYLRRARLEAKNDDLLDAIVAAATAYRMVTGDAQRLPRERECDGRGLRMEMIY